MPNYTWERLIHEICIWWEPSCACNLSLSWIYLFIHRTMCMQDYASSRTNLWRTWTSIPGLTFMFCAVINVWSCIQSEAIPWLETDDSSIAQQSGTWEAWVQVPVLTNQSMDLILVSSHSRWQHLHHIAGYSTPPSSLFLHAHEQKLTQFAWWHVGLRGHIFDPYYQQICLLMEKKKSFLDFSGFLPRWESSPCCDPLQHKDPNDYWDLKNYFFQ